MTRLLNQLEERVAVLEAEQPEARKPWFAAYAETLTEEEFESEADWIIPTALRSFIRGGTPGYPNHDRPPDGLAQHPEFEDLWQRGRQAHDRVSHKAFVSGWHQDRDGEDFPPDVQRPQAPSSGDLYDFWTKRGDEEQEQMRQQLGKKLLELLPEPVHEFLTGWAPSSQATCTTHPSDRYFEWQVEKARAERRTND